jgi:mannitol 2-dehydrogenase
MQSLEEAYSIRDDWPVVCEPFSQWVIEDHFVSGRPPWEDAGAAFVPDVAPYEKMKIRLLNAGHSVLGFLGTLYGYTYIYETVQDPLFAEFLRRFMDEEVTPILDDVPGINLEAYKDSLVSRFANPHIKDQLARICLESSSKIPKFLLPTIREQLQKDGPVGCAALAVAAWCRYAEGVDEQGGRYPVNDKLEALLREKALASRHDPLTFLKIESLFGDLVNSEKFAEAYSAALHDLYLSGVKKSMQAITGRPGRRGSIYC